MAYKHRNGFVVLILSLIFLVSCTMDIFALGSSESTSGTSGTSSGGTYSSTTTYSNEVMAELDGENLYPDTYDESDYTSWQTYDFGTEYVYNVETKSWEGTSPVE
ncbi:MAG: hypothetical protein IKT95_06715, partial [Spirochaetales bacterium]|nr:hypothetical protein [Spirochaetales bacterium]